MKKRKYTIIGLIVIVLGILSFFMYQSYAYYKVNYTGNIINTTVGEFGVYDYAYTGSVQEFVVPVNGYYEIELWGGGGAIETNSNYGGKASYTSGEIYLEKNEVIYLYVGGAGGRPTYCPIQTVIGWNGGFIDDNCRNDPALIYGDAGPVGGGATDIRLVSGAWNNSTSLRSRIMVASGGGSSRGCVGAAGGGLIGNNGCAGTPSANHNLDVIGKGATQTSGGATGSQTDRYDIWFDMQPGGFGYGGRGTLAYEGGGSGGYYGGGGASVATGNIGNGGSGSSYISGYAGVNSVQQTGGTATQPLHTNNTIHYSGKYFINGKMESGVSNGNGKAKITYVGSLIPQRTNTKLDNVRYIKQCQTSDTSAETTRNWVELQAIKEGVNIAKGKTVMGTVAENSSRPYSLIVDGNIDANGWSYAGVSGGPQCITVDLGQVYELDEIALWHYWEGGRTYYGNVLSVGETNVSGTGSLSTIIHNYLGTTGYAETSQGKRYSAWD